MAEARENKLRKLAPVVDSSWDHAELIRARPKAWDQPSGIWNQFQRAVHQVVKSHEQVLRSPANGSEDPELLSPLRSGPRLSHDVPIGMEGPPLLPGIERIQRDSCHVDVLCRRRCIKLALNCHESPCFDVPRSGLHLSHPFLFLESTLQLARLLCLSTSG